MARFLNSEGAYGIIAQGLHGCEAALIFTPVVAIVSSRLMLGKDFTFGEVTGILLIGAGLALLSLIGWAASRRGQMK